MQVSYAMIKSVWPSFSTLWNNYPTASQYKGDDLIDKIGLPEWLHGANTCAIRLSYALIQSGHTIDIKENEFNWSGVRASRGGNEKYIIRVATFRQYLENRKGPADVVSKSKADFLGKKGIIVFQNCPSFKTATGHVDVFDGQDCKGQAYFNECFDIRLFELSDRDEL
ncbi:uncharacterized protein LOC116297769 isoform X2 [Actinia tenebrosa]|uniref:Uncharacterized protein LOC116297769 isoform X2 n=1 Tax=Actinia tenebrosa TaxID=6105 RepID=A0A6P8I293_ACTTE|nr:uncharacterized protein LOC116297769 isoform X2 [Actinia tenebrosa]